MTYELARQGCPTTPCCCLFETVLEASLKRALWGLQPRNVMPRYQSPHGAQPVMTSF
jgi:hypothetical protein